MPYRDGTGPMGNGRPGRGLGPCGKGGFVANGRRGNRGFCNRMAGPNTFETGYTYSKENLSAQKEELQAQLDWINKELEK